MAADAKLGFDDNAAFRHKDLFAKRDSSQEDPRSAFVWRLHSLLAISEQNGQLCQHQCQCLTLCAYATLVGIRLLSPQLPGCHSTC